MRNSTIVSWAIGIIGVAVLAAYYMLTSQPDTGVTQVDDLANASGAKLEISVAGEANGKIVLELFDDVAPEHVARISELARAGAYDNVVFHRVIDGFMAQTGDVEFGVSGGDTARAGQGGSDLPDLRAEFSDRVFERGVVGMARSNNPNSANSQFFIMFARAPNLNGQYTILGQVTEGLDVLDAIKRGLGPNGSVLGEPDKMVSVRVIE